MQNSYDIDTLPPGGPRSPSASRQVRSISTFPLGSGSVPCDTPMQEVHAASNVRGMTLGILLPLGQLTPILT